MELQLARDDEGGRKDAVRLLADFEGLADEVLNRSED